MCRASSSSRAQVRDTTEGEGAVLGLRGSQRFPYSQPKMNTCTFLRQVSFHGDTTYFSLWKYRTGNEPGAQVTDASRSTEVRLRMLRSCSRRGWGRRRHFSSTHRGARDGTTRDGPRSGPQRVNPPPHHSDSSQI